MKREKRFLPRSAEAGGNGVVCSVRSGVFFLRLDRRTREWETPGVSSGR